MSYSIKLHVEDMFIYGISKDARYNAASHHIFVDGNRYVVGNGKLIPYGHKIVIPAKDYTLFPVHWGKQTLYINKVYVVYTKEDKPCQLIRLGT